MNIRDLQVPVEFSEAQLQWMADAAQAAIERYELGNADITGYSCLTFEEELPREAPRVLKEMYGALYCREAIQGTISYHGASRNDTNGSWLHNSYDYEQEAEFRAERDTVRILLLSLFLELCLDGSLAEALRSHPTPPGDLA